MRNKIKFTPGWADISCEDRPRGFYVYVHRRTTDGSVFYVGKGRADRAWRWGSRRSMHWENVARKNGATVEVIRDGLTEHHAFELEREEISRIGLENLTNHTTGGEGHTGRPAPNRRAVECSNGLSFDSCKDAEVWLRANGHPKASSSTISACCKRRIKSAHGFDWKYSGESREFEYIPRETRIGIGHGKTVIRSDGVRYRSATEAAKQMKSTTGRGCNVAISAACRKNSALYGYTWKYEKGPN